MTNPPATTHRFRISVQSNRQDEEHVARAIEREVRSLVEAEGGTVEKVTRVGTLPISDIVVGVIIGVAVNGVDRAIWRAIDAVLKRRFGRNVKIEVDAGSGVGE